jgi:uncharacterized protein involved in copper resistance
MWHNLTVLIFGVLCTTALAAHAEDDGRDAGGRATPGAVAEMDHSKMDHGAMELGAAKPAPTDHSKMNMDAAAPLPMLAAPPASGKAREAGFDGTEMMASTSADASLAVRCAQASRGLIVVDRATWVQCTGKPVTQEHQH